MNTASVFFDENSLNEEVNRFGRKIKNFQYDCDFYNFSDFSKSADKLDAATAVPRYCYTRSANSETAIYLWGDSHAQMLFYGLFKNLDPNFHLSQIARAGCNPSIHQVSDKICEKVNQFALSEIAIADPAVVIVAQRDAWNAKEAKDIQVALLSRGVKEIIFVGKSPEWTSNLPKLVLRKYWMHTPQRSTAYLNTQNDQLDEAAKLSISSFHNAYFASLRDYLCNQEGCLVYVGSNVAEGITSLDGNHLSPAASDWVAKEFLVPLINKFPKSN